MQSAGEAASVACRRRCLNFRANVEADPAVSVCHGNMAHAGSPYGATDNLQGPTACPDRCSGYTIIRDNAGSTSEDDNLCILCHGTATVTDADAETHFIVPELQMPAALCRRRRRRRHRRRPRHRRRIRRPHRRPRRQWAPATAPRARWPSRAAPSSLRTPTASTRTPCASTPATRPSAPTRASAARRARARMRTSS